MARRVVGHVDPSPGQRPLVFAPGTGMATASAPRRPHPRRYARATVPVGFACAARPTVTMSLTHLCPTASAQIRPHPAEAQRGARASPGLAPEGARTHRVVPSLGRPCGLSQWLAVTCRVVSTTCLSAQDGGGRPGRRKTPAIGVGSVEPGRVRNWCSTPPPRVRGSHARCLRHISPPATHTRGESW